MVNPIHLDDNGNRRRGRDDSDDDEADDDAKQDQSLPCPSEDPRSFHLPFRLRGSRMVADDQSSSISEIRMRMARKGG